MSDASGQTLSCGCRYIVTPGGPNEGDEMLRVPCEVHRRPPRGKRVCPLCGSLGST